MSMNEIVYAVCNDCGWSKEFTEDNSFAGQTFKSAKQALRGHCGSGECDYENADIDMTPLG